MKTLPTLLDPEDAIEHYLKHDLCDAEKAYLIAYLAKAGYTNREIRSALNIEKVYTVTHLKRAGSLCDEALTLWLNNPTRISLSHVRFITRLPHNQQLNTIRETLAGRWSVQQLIQSQQAPSPLDADVKRYCEQMSEVLGRGVNIDFNTSQKRGSLILDFWSLDDLESLAKQLGFEPEGGY